MSQVPNWFDRNFEFSFPVELYPNLCVRLRGAPARLEELVRAHAHERLVQKPEKGWSAQEHAGHLADVEPLWMARVDDYLAGGAELTAADLSNRKTHEAGHNQRRIEEILAEFRKARLQLVNRVGGLEAALFARSIPHPRLTITIWPGFGSSYIERKDVGLAVFDLLYRTSQERGGPGFRGCGKTMILGGVLPALRLSLPNE
jgi:hypothetical protein